MIGSGPVPGDGDLVPGDGNLGADIPQGLSWSWDMDFETLLTALNEPPPWARPPPELRKPASATSGPDSAVSDSAVSDSAVSDSAAPDRAISHDGASAGQGEEDQEALLDEYLACESHEVPLCRAAGRIAESLSPGPDLAGWLATASVRDLEDGALAGVATSYRRLASWAQAGELAAVAQLASRSAAKDEKIGVDVAGRPATIPAEAAAQVSLALAMSQYGASWWTDLAVTLSWRLPATGAALAGGQVDLSRARLIAEVTGPLDDDAAQAVEALVLPAAGEQTTGQLRAVLRRAVIAADPDGAERRRKEAERRAKVCLYPDAEGTATLAGHSLPGITAAAALARINALACAMKASGAGGGIDLLRAQAYLGLLLGTLPYIPPAPDGPPDIPPADGPGGPGVPPPDAAGPWDDIPLPVDEADPGSHAPFDDCDPPWAASGGTDDDDPAAAMPAPAWPELPAFIPSAGESSLARPAAGLLDLSLPWSTWAGMSPEPGTVSRLGPVTPPEICALADLATTDPAARWRVIVTNSAGQAVAVAPVPRVRARVRPDQRTAAVGRDNRGRDGPPTAAGLIGRVTLTVSEDVLQDPLPQRSAPTNDMLAGALRAAAKAAAAAAAQSAARSASAVGCRHEGGTGAYRPSPRLWEYVVARDLTCRFLSCRQPAWRGDLDHTRPYGQGGPTCACNLGGLCRFHHLIKHHPGWQLTQPEPGVFQWITPAGRRYVAAPDVHSV